MYHVTHDLTPEHRPDLVLTGTAEIPLAGMFTNKVFYPQELPAKLDVRSVPKLVRQVSIREDCSAYTSSQSWCWSL